MAARRRAGLKRPDAGSQSPGRSCTTAERSRCTFPPPGCATKIDVPAGLFEAEVTGGRRAHAPRSVGQVSWRAPMCREGGPRPLTLRTRLGAPNRTHLPDIRASRDFCGSRRPVSNPRRAARPPYPAPRHRPLIHGRLASYPTFVHKSRPVRTHALDTRWTGVGHHAGRRRDRRDVSLAAAGPGLERGAARSLGRRGSPRSRTGSARGAPRFR
jgi:hypothetical protein